jgi:hypothetical protein
MAPRFTPRLRLTNRQRRQLAKLAARTSAAHAVVIRARIILPVAGTLVAHARRPDAHRDDRRQLAPRVRVPAPRHCNLLGALEVGTGRVFGRVVQHRTADAMVRFLEAIAQRYPDQQIHVVWDNLNIHGDGKPRRWTMSPLERSNHRQLLRISCRDK